MASIRIKVGASLEANALTVFAPLEKAAERARAKIEKSFQDAAKAPRQVERATKSSGDKLIQEVEREGAKIVAEEEKAQRGRLREVERAGRERVQLERQATREIERMLEQDNRARDRVERARSERRGGAIGIGRRAAISVSRGTAVAFGLGGRAISMGVGAAEDFLQGVGVETTLAPHAARAVDLEQRANAVTSAGYIPGGAGAQGIRQNPEELLKQIQQVGDYAAMSGNEIAEGLQKFVGLTGDLETGRNTLKSLAELSKATNSNFVDMSAAAAEVSNNLGDVPDKGKVIESVMRVIAGQGKLGAVEIKDLARQMAKIATSANKFEGGAAANIGDLGILAQMAKLRGGAASATQAATSVQAFARDLIKPTTLKHWTAAGLSPFTDSSKTTIRKTEELVLESLRYSHGDQTKLAQLFPNSMSMRAVQGFANIYSSANGTHDDKMQAVVAAFDAQRRAALDAAEVTRAFKAAMGTAQSQVQLANNRLDEMAQQLTTALLPAVAELAPAIVAMTPAILDAISSLKKLLGIKSESKPIVDKELIDAANKELGAAVASPEVLERGEHGAVITRGQTVDRAHKKVLEDKSTKLAAEIAALEKTHAAHGAELAKRGRVTDFADQYGFPSVGLSLGVHHDDRKKFEEETRHLNELKIEQNRTNTILGDIRLALTSGRAQLGPPAPPAKPPGVMPAETPQEH